MTLKAIAQALTEKARRLRAEADECEAMAAQLGAPERPRRRAPVRTPRKLAIVPNDLQRALAKKILDDGGHG